jgi:putative oxidoreductase
MLYDFLFPQYCRDRGISILILCLRLFFGVMLMIHGLGKMMHFQELSQSFPNILGFGSYMSLMLTIFVEFCCSMFLIFGLLIRITILPLLISMAVAFFDVHNAYFPEGELSFIYLVLFLLLYITGPGKYSVDYLIDKRFHKDAKEVEEVSVPLEES